MRSNEPKAFYLGSFWFGIQVVWGALLGVSLQARATQLGGAQALAAYGALAAAGAVVAALTQISIGIISDRRRAAGSKRLEFHGTGAVLAAVALMWFYTAPSFAQLIAAVVAVQIAMNVAIGPYQAVIPDFITEEGMDNASSWMAALQSMGNAAGALIASEVTNARLAAVLIAACLVGSWLFTALHVRGLSLLPATVERGLRISRAFIDLFISRGMVFLGFYTLLGYLFFYVRDVLGGDPRRVTGVLILVTTASAAVGAIAAARFAARMDRRVVANIGGAAFIAALFAFLFSKSLGAIGVSALVAGVAWGTFVTADWALGCYFLPRQALATAMGIWNLAVLIPQILAPLIATAVLSALHALQSSAAPRIAFLTAACEVAVGIAWIWRLPASQRSVDPVLSGNRR
jgi:MFS family permease